MKKNVKKFITVILSVVMLCSTCLPLFASAADESISPYFVNCNRCTCSFVAGDGAAYVDVSYYAKSDVFTQAKLTVKIQKRFLGLFWTTVDIGEPNNEWVAYCYDVMGDFYNSFPLESTGTYRAVFTVEISGTSGEVDVIEDTIQSTYN